jgi:hypothetical protein
LKISKISTYPNKKPSNFTRRNTNSPSPPFDTSPKKTKEPQNNKKKIEKFQHIQIKNPQTSQDEKQISPFPRF